MLQSHLQAGKTLQRQVWQMLYTVLESAPGPSLGSCLAELWEQPEMIRP